MVVRDRLPAALAVSCPALVIWLGGAARGGAGLPEIGLSPETYVALAGPAKAPRQSSPAIDLLWPVETDSALPELLRALAAPGGRSEVTGS